MTFFIIKMILWFPIFIIAITLGGIGVIISRLPSLFVPIAFFFLKSCNFILKLIMNDMVHSAKQTPLEKHIPFIEKHIKQEEQ
jgi:hypothetical protein